MHLPLLAVHFPLEVLDEDPVLFDLFLLVLDHFLEDPYPLLELLLGSQLQDLERQDILSDPSGHVDLHVKLPVFHSEALGAVVEEEAVEVLDVLEEHSELDGELLVGKDPLESVKGLTALQLDDDAVLSPRNHHV